MLKIDNSSTQKHYDHVQKNKETDGKFYNSYEEASAENTESNSYILNKTNDDPLKFILNGPTPGPYTTDAEIKSWFDQSDVRGRIDESKLP